MTNQEKDQKLSELASTLANGAWNTAKKAGKVAAGAALDPDVLAKVGSAIKEGAKAGAKFALKTGVNLVTSPKKALHTAMGVAEKAVNAIPLIGGTLSFLFGTTKDALLDAKIENLSKNIEGIRDGLENLANSVGEALDGLRGEMEQALGEMGARVDEIEQFTKALAAAQDQINQKVQSQIQQLQETLKEHDQKIKDNAEKIFKEQIKLEDVRSELKDQIRTTNTNLENLRKEQEETKHDFEKYKHQINEKTAQTEQAFEDLQADYTRKNKILETQIKDNEEQLEDFNEDLRNVEYEQKKLSLEHQEFAETLEEQVNLAYEQKRKLDLVVSEIEEIHEEFNTKINRLTQSQLEQEEKVDEAVFTAKKATRKVDELADKLEKHNKKVNDLEKQIEKNKQETQKVKEEAQRANERIDNLLKTQQLLDNSKETQALDKIQKTLELKAEEAQLLASLELLKKTQKLITNPTEREWKVGIKEGTETNIPRPEGFMLDPNSCWSKQYTSEQLREWGWDTRLLGDHDAAPLTDLDKRKPEEAAPSQAQEQSQSAQPEQQNTLYEVIEETKSQLLAQLQEIQEQINANLTPLEKTTAPQEDSESEDEETEELREELEQKEIQLKAERAQSQAKLTKSRNKQASLQQQKETTKSEIIKEQKNLKKIEQSLGKPATTPQQKQKLLENKEKGEEKLTQLQQQLEKIEQAKKEQKNKEEQTEQEIKKLDQQIEKINQQKPTSIEAKKIEKEIKDAEQQVQQAQQEYLEQQWQDLKKTEEQILNDSPETPSLKKIEEKIQEIKESQSSTAAPQKSMSIYMLYLIIFLLEYIVYKKNGLTGLIILNVILAILYYKKDTILKHKQLWEKYFLIIGYVVGNVLAYSAPEQEKYKWPCVIGYNVILLTLYGYTHWQSKKELSIKEEELVQLQEEFTEQTIKNETKYVERLQEAEQTLAKVKERTKNSKTIDPSFFSVNTLFTSQADAEKGKVIYERIQKKYGSKLQIEENYLASPQAQQFLQLVKESGVELTPEELELASKIQTKQNKQVYQEFSQTVAKIPSFPQELTKILTKLLTNLRTDQIIAISAQSPYVKDKLSELETVYTHLKPEQKLKLLNSGLDSLQINNLEKKQELLDIRLTLKEEEKSFDLSPTEKENILRLITSKVSEEQLKTYEDYGVPLYNASNWQITSEHKKSLLKLAEDQINLTSEEEKTALLNTDPSNLSKFPLSPNQENILKTLAPLGQEYNYSEELLTRLRSLNSRNFLMQKEIIPVAHKKTSDPYQELKKEILTKEYKKVREEIKQKEKVELAEKNQAIRNSLLPSLLFFAQMNLTNLSNQAYRLSKETFQEKEDWVSAGAIDSQQRDLLFISGFKLIPKYNFFDLLFFVVEKVAKLPAPKQEPITEEKEQQIEEYKTQILIILDNWQQEEKNNTIGSTKSKLSQKLKWTITSLTNEQLNSSEQLTFLQELLTDYPNSDVKLNNLVKAWRDAEKPLSLSNNSFDYFLKEHPELKEEWEKYLDLLAEKQEKELERKANYLSSLSAPRKTVGTATNITSLEEKYERLTDAYEKIRILLEEREDKFFEVPQEPAPVSSQTGESKTAASTSPYDNLFANLDQEEAERLKKKKAREEAKRKLAEDEFKRRQDNLNEKDRKLKAEEEKRQREKELEEQEEEKRKQAQQAREQALKEDRQTYLNKEEERIAKAKQRAEEELKFQEEQMKKEKERRENEIEEMRKKAEQEEKRLEEERKLSERELEEELAKVALEDKEGRQKIKQKFEKLQLENRKKAEEEMRKNDDALSVKRAELEAVEIKNKETLRTLQEEARMQEELGKKNRAAAEENLRLAKAKKFMERDLRQMRDGLWEAILNYYWNTSEAKAGTRNPQMTSGGKLKDWLSSYPNMEFNIFAGDLVTDTNWSSYRTAMETWNKVVGGSRFVTQDEFKRLLEEKATYLNFVT